MVQTKIFKSNKSQAVRLPKAVSMPEEIKEVDVIAVGNQRIISPAGTAWDAWFDGESVTADYLDTREQPVAQERESL